MENIAIRKCKMQYFILHFNRQNAESHPLIILTVDNKINNVKFYKIYSHNMCGNMYR